MSKKNFYIVGNWKSNKTLDEAVIWMQDFNILWRKSPLELTDITIVLCPAAIHLTTLSSLISLEKLPIQLGLQDISPYEKGTYTGAISSDMVKGLATYTIVGHSERRTWFYENDEILSKKVMQAKRGGLTTIYCVQNAGQPIPSEVDMVAYEPPNAISKGDPYKTQAQNPSEVNETAQSIRSQIGDHVQILYGGSITPENVLDYYSQKNINGVLPGGASLKPDTFYNLIKNVSSS